MIFDGVEFPSAEHAYQYGKPRRQEVRDWLMAAPSPALLAMAAHGLYHWDIAPGWSKTKVDRMRRVLLAKFTQHEDLRGILLSTGNARLVETGKEDNVVNRFWGEVNGVGKNTLGVLLTEVRNALAGHHTEDQGKTASRNEEPEQNVSSWPKLSASAVGI